MRCFIGACKPKTIVSILSTVTQALRAGLKIMTKFSSFLVFAFGIFVIVAIGVLSFKHKSSSSGRTPSDTNTELPQSDMSPLELGSRDQFMRELDKLFASGGLAAVRDFVEAELVPGRLVNYGKSGGAEARTYRLIDRELRRCDQGGATLLNKPPVLARASAMLRIDGNGRIESWQRLDARQPYSITVWWGDAGK